MKLPINCTAEYHKDFISQDFADQLFNSLLQLTDLTSPAIIYAAGTKMVMDYGKSMFIDQELLDSNRFDEKQWGKTMIWTKLLVPLKEKLEKIYEINFKACVAIYYSDGDSGVDFHSDFIAFGSTDTIPSISLGEEREFLLREKKTADIFSINLSHGSMILMGEGCQTYYEHSLPTHSKYKKPRINLTFRQVD